VAGGFGGSSDEDLISGINVTPLVDVVLVLLIIFMITAPVIYQSAIKVQLPKARTGEESPKSPLQFSLNKEGDIFWGSEKIDWAGLGQRLSAIGPSITEQTALISADEQTAHGTVIRLMDVLRNSGLTRFALNVDSANAAK
jgi:biopolymer transport protein ExbD